MATISKKTCREMRQVIEEAIRGCIDDYGLAEAVDGLDELEGDPLIKVEFTIKSCKDGQLTERATFEIGRPKKDDE
jgi:hypothetical protein